MTGIFIIAAVSLIVSYLIFLTWLLTKTKRKCECRECKTSIHVERNGRPGLVKKLAGFLPLKYYRCRHCSNTFFLFENVPDNEPVRMKARRSRSASVTSI